MKYPPEVCKAVEYLVGEGICFSQIQQADYGDLFLDGEQLKWRVRKKANWQARVIELEGELLQSLRAIVRFNRTQVPKDPFEPLLLNDRGERATIPQVRYAARAMHVTKSPVMLPEDALVT